MRPERAIRRLAAILVADVVGYARLMAADEGGALASLNRHREAEFDPFVARHNGRIVTLMGDGTLVEFASIVDAVECALAIQKAAAGGRPELTLRIGVNLGDIIIQGEDIYGDGVNVAARLEPLAAPGGVCVSSVVRESIRDRIDASFNDSGEIAVKNIARPVKVWHWHPTDPGRSSGPTQAAGPASARRRDGPSIAVLAFANMSGDAEQEYFSDGLAEDIITDLSKVSGLTVVARNSSFAYKDRSVDLRDVGRELGVAYVLEGSVRRAGQRVRVTAQLIDATTGGHLWADRYDGELADVFAVQDAVTLRIVEALKIKLSPAERAGIAATGTSNPKAHDCFMRMRDLLLSPGLNQSTYARATEHGRRAIDLDPDYAQALGLLSIFQWVDFHNGWSGDAPDVVAARANALADRAVSIDPDEPLANIAVCVAARWRGAYDLAARAVDKALTRSPDFGLALLACADVAIGGGRHRDAIPLLERAIRLDPGYSHQHLQFLGMAHFLLGNCETAALIFRERLYLVRDTDVGRAWLAATLDHLGEVDEARADWAELMTLRPDFRLAPRLARLRFAQPADPERVMAGLAKAHLPAEA